MFINVCFSIIMRGSGEHKFVEHTSVSAESYTYTQVVFTLVVILLVLKK